jgi:excisionase family DNA binding protein
MIVRSELERMHSLQPSCSARATSLIHTQGLTEKPLYKLNEVCSLFGISRMSVYDWIDAGKLRKVKIRSRVYFLGEDVRRLMQPVDTSLMRTDLDPAKGLARNNFSATSHNTDSPEKERR